MGIGLLTLSIDNVEGTGMKKNITWLHSNLKRIKEKFSNVILTTNYFSISYRSMVLRVRLLNSPRNIEGTRDEILFVLMFLFLGRHRIE